MDRAILGRTGLDVSIACLGTGGHSRLGQAYGATFQESVDVVNAAIDLGIDFIDTSVGYETEEIVGAAIKGRRDSLVISTKSHIVQKGTSFTGTDFVTGAEYRELVEDNLRRLGTDYIDVFHVHGICANQYQYCVDEILPVVYAMRDEGKLRFTAISERFNVEPTHAMLDLAIKDDYFDVMMVGILMINQTASRTILPTLEANNIGVQAIYAVRGKLGNPELSKALVDELIAIGEVDPDDLDDLDDPLGFLLADGVAESLPEACYRFDRYEPGVDTVLTGTGSIEHLEANIRSINLPPLPAEVTERLRKIFGRVESMSGD